MSVSRITALLAKEFAELARNRAAMVPVLLTAVVCLALPFFVALVIPAITGEPLSHDTSFAQLAASGLLGRADPTLTGEPRVQAFVFQQFLLMFLLIPISGAMAFAAYSVIGEKQGRTLEPLLATPVTTPELLVGKILAALIPSLVIMEVSVLVYLGGMAAFAEPRVAAAILTLRTLILVLLVAPLASLVSLEMAVIVSSRVNDPRTAQQIGVLIILPLVGLMVAQFSGTLQMTKTLLLVSCGALFAVAVALTLVGVAVFDRESILTRWR